MSNTPTTTNDHITARNMNKFDKLRTRARNFVHQNSHSPSSTPPAPGRATVFLPSHEIPMETLVDTHSLHPSHVDNNSNFHPPHSSSHYGFLTYFDPSAFQLHHIEDELDALCAVLDLNRFCRGSVPQDAFDSMDLPAASETQKSYLREAHMQLLSHTPDWETMNNDDIPMTNPIPSSTPNPSSTTNPVPTASECLCLGDCECAEMAERDIDWPLLLQARALLAQREEEAAREDAQRLAELQRKRKSATDEHGSEEHGRDVKRVGFMRNVLRAWLERRLSAIRQALSRAAHDERIVASAVDDNAKLLTASEEHSPMAMSGVEEGDLTGHAGVTAAEAVVEATEALDLTRESENGRIEGQVYFWRQDKNNVWLSIWVPAGTRSGDVHVRLCNGVLSVSLQRRACESSREVTLPGSACGVTAGAGDAIPDAEDENSIVWFEDRLAYPVKSPEDGEEDGRSEKINTGIPDGNSESNACIFRGTRVQRPLFCAAPSTPTTVTIPDVEWELRDMIGSSERVVTITLEKDAPPGLRIWWRRAVVSGADIPVEQISGRRGQVLGSLSAPSRVDATLNDVAASMEEDANKFYDHRELSGFQEGALSTIAHKYGRVDEGVGSRGDFEGIWSEAHAKLKDYVTNLVPVMIETDDPFEELSEGETSPQ